MVAGFVEEYIRAECLCLTTVFLQTKFVRTITLGHMRR
jgi:hypothetical protein